MAAMRIISGAEIYAWPEFRAFAERLGIPLDVQLVNLSIRIDVRKSAEIILKCRGYDARDGASDES